MWVLVFVPPAAAPMQAQPAITMVSTVGCAVKTTEPDRVPSWTLTHAAEPEPTRDPFGSRDPQADAKRPLGSLTFALDHVIEHLSEEDRKEYREAGDFIVPARDGADAQLRNGHRVAVTGLLRAARGAGGGGRPQITITSVASLALTCP